MYVFQAMQISNHYMTLVKKVNFVLVLQSSRLSGFKTPQFILSTLLQKAVVILLIRLAIRITIITILNLPVFMLIRLFGYVDHIDWCSQDTFLQANSEVSITPIPFTKSLWDFSSGLWNIAENTPCSFMFMILACCLQQNNLHR